MPPSLFLEWGPSAKLPLISSFFIMTFNFGYVSLHHHQLWLKQMYTLKIVLLIIRQTPLPFMKLMTINK